jgi:hypothetical protein
MISLKIYITTLEYLLKGIRNNLFFNVSFPWEFQVAHNCCQNEGKYKKVVTFLYYYTKKSEKGGTILMQRLYHPAITEHMRENQQMLFLMGPRQVGKTTTARSLSEDFKLFFYYSLLLFITVLKFARGQKIFLEL